MNALPDLRFTSTPSFTLHVADFGGEGQPLLLVHGLGGSWSNWMAVGPHLAGAARVAAVDLPGFGSSPPGPDFALETHARAVEELLGTWGWSNVTLIGNSMGGLVSEMVSARAPDLVSDLILVSPATPPDLQRRDIDPRIGVRLLMNSLPVVGPLRLRSYVARTSPEQQTRETLALVTAHPDRLRPDIVALGIDQTRRRRAVPWAWEAMSASGRDIARMFADRRRFDEMIRSLPTGALVVQGLADRIVSPAGVGRLARLRPDWDVVEWPGVGHVPMIERPEEFAELVLDRLSSRSAIPEGG